MKQKKFLRCLGSVSLLALQAAPLAPVAGVLAMPAMAVAQELETVIVTARRRDENLQTVPVSATVLSQQDLDRLRVGTLVDLAHLSPNMSVGGAQRNGTSVVVRGYGGFNPGSGPAVIVYQNEVPLPFDAQGSAVGSGLYYDLQGVQVLKGPQGTLFGRNTTGGALLFQSKRPSDQLGGYVQGTYGNHDTIEATGALNVPVVSDKLLVRVAFQRQLREGFTHIQSAAGHPNGLDMDDNNSTAGRLTVTYKPADSIRNDLIVDGLRIRTNGTAMILRDVGFASALFPALPAILAQQNALGVRTGVPIENDPQSRVSRWNVSDIAEVDLVAGVKFRNIFSYTSQNTQNLQYDGDASPFAIFTSDTQTPVRRRQYTEEPQLQGTSFGNRLEWVIGGFYLDSAPQPLTVTRSVVFGSPSFGTTTNGEKSTAVYGHGTYDFGDFAEGLKASFGYRYTWDRRVAISNAFSGRARFSAPTWNAGLSYQMSPQSLVYAQVRRGYRTGGFNATATLVPNQTFQPEHVTDLEAGLKTEFALGSVPARFNLAVFRDRFKDIQLTETVVEVAGTRAISVTRNAGDATKWGIEAEARISPVAGLELGANVGVLRTNLTRTATGVAPFQLTYQPRFSYALDARYTLPLAPSVGEVSIGANLVWQSDTYVAAAASSFDKQRGYGLVNLSADWNGMAGSEFDLSLYATNVTNKVYAIGGFILMNSLGYAAAMYGEPRMYGARLRYHFGGE
jgi:iron complex outermembrane receptor protein